MITWIFACVVTATAMGMAAVAGWDRGGSGIDRALLVALSVTICMGTHLIPAMSRRKVAWLLWAGCLVGTVYGHVTFFVNSSIRAGLVRAQTSAQVTGTEKQLEAVREVLSQIRARPIATVAAELSGARQWRRRRALELELAEAERAAHLRDELVQLTATATAAVVTATENPVTKRVATVTGRNPASIDVVTGVGFSILLELVGALLWVEILRRPVETPSDKKKSPTAPGVLTELREAVDNGTCKPTVAGIRVFMGCGQARAMALRRQLFSPDSGFAGSDPFAVRGIE